LLEANDYHLIFDLNGVLVAMSEGQTRTCMVVLKAWPQGIPFCLCKKIYSVHMVLGNEEKIFEALGRKLVFTFCLLE
jgi:hypothetical protein